MVFKRIDLNIRRQHSDNHKISIIIVGLLWSLEKITNEQIYQ